MDGPRIPTAIRPQAERVIAVTDQGASTIWTTSTPSCAADWWRSWPGGDLPLLSWPIGDHPLLADFDAFVARIRVAAGDYFEGYGWDDEFGDERSFR